MSEKWVYLFEEGNAQMRDLLGGKGANLAEMTNIGLPVPPGFTITTKACIYYMQNGEFPPGMWEQTLEALRKVEEKMGKKLGDPKNPLLVSVRSGAKFSMPGMMDTVLNLGLNDESVKGLIEQTGNPRFAWDAYRRFVMMFGNIVLGIDRRKFDALMDEMKEKKGVTQDVELTAEDLKELTKQYKELVKKEKGFDFPEDPLEQLKMAIEAVFKSWNNPRAIAYREREKIPHDLGTAVNVQSMVFGNMGEDSGTGVAFTRDVATGEKRIYGEFLFNAQGEDVVAGIRTPLKIEDLERRMPEIHEQFVRICEILEKHYRDVMDIEFTIEKGKLYILQCRVGKRTAQAAIKIAVDMAKEGLISKEEAVMRIDPADLDQLLHRQIDPKAELKVLAKGVAASPGAAVGKVVFDAHKAAEWGKNGEKVILVRPETNPDDIVGMLASQGILTARGGMTSHAAVVARGFGIPAVVGCEAIKIDEERNLFTANETVVKEGDVITIDGSTGRVILGEAPLIEPRLTDEVKELLSWADSFRRLGVRTNADTPADAQKAFEFGAEGVGLCRTEHMFFGEERVPYVQKMILADTTEEREEALEKLLPFQREDFIGIFKAMQGRPVVIRLIDPPLHEFLPRYETLLEEVITLRLTNPNSPELAEKEKLLHRVSQLRELNPMLGLRGCRLGILYPEIVKMQVRAIFEAAAAVAKEGLPVHPEVMIPLVGHVNELKYLRPILEEVAKEVLEREGVDIEYHFGTMIEIPRAALTSSEIAKVADFYSFGTNDLTQTVFGFSRDDAEGKFIGPYLEKGILPHNPFEVLDRDGVGKLMKMCIEEARKANPNIVIGICGEHGGEPESVKLCHELGLDYVSCSPLRVPIARLAAAQANLKTEVFEDK
ncbi:MAG: pyruvate, phosphate dikinase [bacterium]